ncbi:membrane protein insertase YidC [Candidatus Dojkabacteria bacterium]|nr:membrane protein insertase YidC [Candidatus Dojkabacteria bacterium]
MDGGFLFVEPLFELVFNSLIVLYRFLGEDLGLALIGIALLSRLIVYPFTVRQLKNVDKNKEFQKKYEEIKEKFSSKKDQEKQAKELAKLQGEYLPGQLSGCLTIILQLLLLIQINYVIRNLLKYGAEGFNTLAYGFVDKFPAGYQFNLKFLGVLNLGESARDQGLTNFEDSWPYLAVAGFLVLTQFFSMRILSGLTKDHEKEAEKKRKREEAKKKREKARKKGEEEEVPSFSEVFQDTNRQMMMFFPLMLGFFSLNYPSGLSLYFATTSLFVIIQQGIMKRDKIIANIKRRYFVDEAETGTEKSMTEDSKDVKNDDKDEKESKASESKKKKKRRKKRKRKSKK